MSSVTVTEAPTGSELLLSTSPHLHSRWTTKQVMWFVVLALVPCVISAVVYFGFYQLLVIATAVVFAVGTEALIQSLMKKPVTVVDGSAVITGLLLGLIVPPNFSLVFTALGAVFSIAIGKMVFGGLGYNIFNPALAGRAFLQAAFPVAITTWTIPHFAVDAVSKATPLAALKFDRVMTDITPLVVGNVGGSLGETSAVAVLLGGIFLLVTGVANWRIPAAMTVGVLIFGGALWMIDPAAPNPVFHIFAGGFLFAAMFMATDMVTSPVTGKGMWIYGFGISLILVLIRIYGGLPEGVMYSILFMNAFVPLINRYTAPRIFGEGQS
ncbi:MAG: RnfABCDGE type electron transport complex subunit D [Bacteroidetes bacterium]|nr:RnfABCDGE type electron transport complex subunit D [Bacteroidota bacterium]